MSNYIFISALLGLCIGSFLNVIIYRVPRGKGIIFTRSSCPSCERKLQPIDLIPLISWLLLKGKCRFCKTKIGFIYPFVEILTGLTFILCLLSAYRENSLALIYCKVLFGWVLLSCLISISFIDISHMVIPRKIIVFGTISGIIFILINSYLISNNLFSNLFEGLYSALIAILGTYFLNTIVEFILKKPGIGGGDGKLFALSGIWLGLSGLEVTVVLSFISAGIFSLIGLATKKIKRGQYIPFGPFICFAIALNWLVGSEFFLINLSDLFWWRI